VVASRLVAAAPHANVRASRTARPPRVTAVRHPAPNLPEVTAVPARRGSVPTAPTSVQRCASGEIQAASRECSACGVRRQDVGTKAPPIVREVLRSLGRPLDAHARGFMEPRFARSLGDVRVHDDARAAASARSIHARAYAVGRDVVFGTGEYAPGTVAGRRLLAHELAHTVQQAGAGSTGDLEIGPPDSAVEWEAEQIAAAHGDGDGRVTLQRTKTVQRAVAKGPAGGCAVCRRAAVAGTLAHPVAQSLFVAQYGPGIIPEATYRNPNDTDNGRLDLLRFDESGTPIVVEIGEIKPDTDSGVDAGKRDLRYYTAELRKWFAPPMFAVNYLDVDAPATTAAFKDNALVTCPPQTLSVRKARLGAPQGLYLYSCVPPGKDIKSCCKSPPAPPIPVKGVEKAKAKKPSVDQQNLADDLSGWEYGYAVRVLQSTFGAPASAAVAVTPEGVAVRVATSSPGPAAQAARVAASPPSPPAPPAAAAGEATTTRAKATAIRTAGRSRFVGTVARLAPRAGLLGAAAAVTVGAAAVLAKHTYGNVIPGTVAAGLAHSYTEMAAATAQIGRWYGRVSEALAAVLEAYSGDEETRLAAGSELLGVLRPLHEGVHAAHRAVEAAARRAQAIADRITPSDLPTFENTLIASKMVRGDYPSPLAPDLTDLAMAMLVAADKLTLIMRRLQDEREAIIIDQSHYVLRER
jgi:hypothetical protein